MMKGANGGLRSVLVLTLAVLLLVAFAVVPASAESAAPIRPFTASYSLQVVEVTPIGSSSWYEVQSGSGQGTHLGLSTETHPMLLVDVSAFPTINLSGPTTFVAANGDALYATMWGAAHYDFTNGTIPGEFEFTISGGTGRFADATGSGVIKGNLVNGVITEDWRGTIAY